MPRADDLRRVLARIDGRGYKAYAEVQGKWTLDGVSLAVDHVQGDPFAAPSKIRLRVPMDRAALPEALARPGVRRMALADDLAREAAAAIRSLGWSSPGPAASDERPRSHRRRDASPGSGNSGRIEIDAGGQEVLERTAVRITDEWVEARIEVGLPAAGRRVLGRDAQSILLEQLPEIAERALRWSSLDGARVRAHVLCVENQEHIRSQLAARGLIAFVADGALLPRESGASERPMSAERTRAFHGPDALRVEIPLANPIDSRDGPISSLSGMGVPRGVTLIVGGGYHGKSTLLRALECGVVPHVPGDGREYVVSDRDLVKVRAEEGRAVTSVDIHAFVDRIPAAPGMPADEAADRTRHFSTTDASGSTSQAAGIAEAIESGARGLLLDEDTSATNFMLRDARMQLLVQKESEPITPFVDRVRELYETTGVSTVLVMGGSGDYFDVADTVIRMRDYTPEEVTAEARAIAARAPTGRVAERPAPLQPPTPRVPLAESFDASRGRRDIKISIKSRDLITYGRQTIDLRAVSQLLDASQTRAVAMAIHLASRRFMSPHAAGSVREGSTMAEVLDRVEALLDAEGLEALDAYRSGPDDERHPGRLARPRRHELAATINRMRGLRVVEG